LRFFATEPGVWKSPDRSGASVTQRAIEIYLINQLVYFRGNERSNPLIRELARQLRNDDIEALAVISRM